MVEKNRIPIKNILIAILVIPLVLAIGLYIRSFTLSDEEKFLDSVEKGDYEDVYNFVQKGVDVNAKKFNTQTALSLATDGEVTKLLLKYGADPNLTTSDGQTPLMFANAEQAELLLEHGADIDKSDDNGWTAIMWASLTGKSDTVRVLIENGAKIENEKEYGTSALILAAQASSNELLISKMLVNAGAKISKREYSGKSAIDYAREAGKNELVRYLEAELAKE